MAGDADIPPVAQQLTELVRENERLREALRHYADESYWLNAREYRGVPGFHARAMAVRALEGTAASAPHGPSTTDHRKGPS